MRRPRWVPRIVLTGVVGVVCLVGNAGRASVTPHDDVGHSSSLHATVALAGGEVRSITLQGVGCVTSMCSRVRAKDVHAESVWLDSLASVRDMAQDADGSVSATFRFKDGGERRVSIIAGNRILYVRGRFGIAERLDLASLTTMDFE